MGASDVTARDSKGRTPLIVGAVLRELETVQEVLMDSEVDVNAQDTDGMSALFYATQRSDGDVLRLLLRRPELNLGAYGHGTGLSYNSILFAAFQDETDCLRVLIQKSLPETREAIRLAKSRMSIRAEHLIRDIGIGLYGKALKDLL